MGSQEEVNLRVDQSDTGEHGVALGFGIEMITWGFFPLRARKAQLRFIEDGWL